MKKSIAKRLFDEEKQKAWKKYILDDKPNYNEYEREVKDAKTNYLKRIGVIY